MIVLPSYSFLNMLFENSALVIYLFSAIVPSFKVRFEVDVDRIHILENKPVIVDLINYFSLLY